MTVNSIRRGLARVVVLVFLAATSSVAQQAGESARPASKGAEPAKGPAKRVSKKLAFHSGESARQPARKLDPRCIPAEGGERVPIARLARVEGNALVSTDSGLVAGAQGQALAEGTRAWTTTNSSLIVSYCDGCSVSLKANQRIEISLDEPCSERLALVESILLEPAVVEGMTVAASSSMTAAVLSGVLPATTPLFGGLGLSGAIATIVNREDEAVSPN